MSSTEQRRGRKAVSGPPAGDPPCLTAALEYAARGLPVFPLHWIEEGKCSCGEPDCTRQGKHPRTPNGRNDATTDPEQIRRWWGPCPNANVGIATGPDVGIWVVGPDGPAGIEALRQLQEVHGPLPGCPRASTGSGGEHLFYAWPTDGDKIPTRANVGGLPIDVRGTGGYVVAAPSRNINGPYLWQPFCSLADEPLRPAPDWLVTWARQPNQKSKPSQQGPPGGGGADPKRTQASVNSSFDLARQEKRARTYARRCAHASPAIEGENGSKPTFKLACKLVGKFGLPRDLALQVMLEVYNPRCQPEWTLKEMEHKIDDAIERHTEQLDVSSPTCASTTFANSHVSQVSHPSHASPPLLLESAAPLDTRIDATVADVALVVQGVSWAWARWLPRGVLSALAADAGVGKTRLVADLCRRVFFGLPWPDGQESSLPVGSPSLWVAADHQHAQIVELCRELGLPPEAVYFNTGRDDPLGGTLLNSAATVADFEARIARVRPWLAVIDTTSNATDQPAMKPEDAQRFYGPLMAVAQRTQVPILCLTHLNAQGSPLGRAIERCVRVLWCLKGEDKVSAGAPRTLAVSKSMALTPEPLRVVMGTGGSSYEIARAAGTEKTPDPELMEKISKYVEQAPGCSSTDLREAFEVKGKDVDEAAWWLVDHGYLHKILGGPGKRNEFRSLKPFRAGSDTVTPSTLSTL